MYDYTQAKMNDDAIRAISSIGLAHLGDAVYELLVRTYLCVHGKATGKGLLIVRAVGVVGNGLDIRVAPAAEHRGLVLRQKG